MRHVQARQIRGGREQLALPDANGYTRRMYRARAHLP